MNTTEQAIFDRKQAELAANPEPATTTKKLSGKATPAEREAERLRQAKHREEKKEEHRLKREKERAERAKGLPIQLPSGHIASPIPPDFRLDGDLANIGEYLVPGIKNGAPGDAPQWIEYSQVRMGVETWQPMCRVPYVIGRAATGVGRGWGKVVTFTDGRGQDHTLVVADAELNADCGPLIARLCDEGLEVAPTEQAHKMLMVYLFECSPEADTYMRAKPGWEGTTTYCSPLGVGIGTDAAGLHLMDGAGAEDREPKGTYEAWQAGANLACSIRENFAYRLGITAGFAGAVIDLCGLPTCGMAFTGKSSRGKSTSQFWQASVSSNPKHGKGVCAAARATANGIESVALTGSGSSVALDELHVLPVDQVALIIMTLAGDIEKVRLHANLRKRHQEGWATFFTASVEETIRAIIHSAKQKMRDGIAVRCLDLNVDGHRLCTAEELAALETCKSNYGWALTPFVEYLVAQGWAADPSIIIGKIDRYTDRLAGDAAQPAERRAARTLAILWFCAVVCHSAGILAPWKDEAHDLDPELMVAGDEDGRAGFFKRMWAHYLTGEGFGLAKPASSVREQFLSSLVKRWKQGLSLAERPSMHRDITTFWYNDKHIFILLSDLTGFLPGLVSDEASLRKLLSDEGLLVKQRKNLVWRTIPGSGDLNHVRLPRSFGPSELEGLFDKEGAEEEAEQSRLRLISLARKYREAPKAA